MYKISFLQIGAALIGVLLAWAMFDDRGAISAALGGAACLIPTLMFALRLQAVSRRADAPPSSYVTAFFVGEFIKIAAAIGFLAAVRLLWPDAHWGALVLGLIVTLQANFFVFLVKP